MKIALLSDAHDHTNHLLSALVCARETGCERIIFLGDMVHLQTFVTLREEWDGPIDLVFGNNEYEWEAFNRYAETSSDTTLHGEYGSVTIDNLRIFFTHLPTTAARAQRSGMFDIVLYGHTHVSEVLQQDGMIIANPGEIQGRRGHPTIGVLDTIERQITIYPI